MRTGREETGMYKFSRPGTEPSFYFRGSRSKLEGV